MDKLRVALEWLKEQHFWVLSVLACLVSVGCWFLASGSLANQFKDNQGAINKQFSDVEQIQRKPYHPNDKVNEREEEEITKLAAKVSQIWSQLDDRQRREVLIWPAQLDANVSRPTDKFTNHIKDKRFGEFIADNFRNRYLNYIQNSFPDLPKIIKALEVEGNASGRGGRDGGMEFGFEAEMSRGGKSGGGNDEIIEKDFLVRWEDQFEIKQQLTWSKRPSSLKIWVTQEDLWVYRTLLEAIAATNTAAGADRYSNAAVRDIYQFEVGRKAAKGLRTAERIFRPQTESARGGELAGGGGELGGMRGGEGGRGMPEFGDGGRGGEGGFGRGDGEGDDTQLLAGRYIDAEGKPLPAPTAQPDTAIEFEGEYKRLPVRLVLNMDQRWLPRLIVEMANAPLQVEVEEVRINPTGDAGGGRSRSGSTKLRALQLASQGGRGGGGGFAAAGRGQGEVLAFDREPQVAKVIVRGTVYLFNPPDQELLDVDSANGPGI